MESDGRVELDDREQQSLISTFGGRLPPHGLVVPSPIRCHLATTDQALQCGAPNA